MPYRSMYGVGRLSKIIIILDKSLQGRDARIAGIVTSGMYGSGSSKPKGAAHSCPSLLINVSPDSGLRQIVRRGHGGQYQDGSERFCFFTSLTKKSVKTGSPNRLSLSLNLTFRGFCENRVFKVSIGRSMCPGFIYQWQKSIIIRTHGRTETSVWRHPRT